MPFCGFCGRFSIGGETHFRHTHPTHTKKANMMLSNSAARALGFVGMLALASPAPAGSMFEATILGKPDIHLRDGNLSACGMRILAVENTEPNDASRNVIDSSVYVSLSGGVVKGTHTKPTPIDIANKKFIPANLPIKKFWFKAPGHTATQPTTGLLDSETKNALFYATSLDSAFGLLGAVVSGETIQIGFQEAEASVSTILYGTVKISEGDLNQLVMCIQELSAQISAEPQKP